MAVKVEDGLSESSLLAYMYMISCKILCAGLLRENLSSRFETRSDSIQTDQLQRLAGILRARM